MLILEFRLIDNNVLYLTEELGIDSIEKIFQLLTSSMNKEEKWSNEFIAIIVHTKQEPKFSHALAKDFKIGSAEVKHVYE
jgi:hypothetical protein